MNKLSKATTRQKTDVSLYIITVVISAVLLIIGNSIVYDKETMFLGGYEDGACSATVTEILREHVEDETIAGEMIGENIILVFECELTSGDRKGETVMAEETIWATDTRKLDKVQVGDKIFVLEAEGMICDWSMYDFDRSVPLWVLGVAFVVLVLIFGRFKGVNTLISLGFTCLAVFVVFLPAVMSEKNIYFWSIITCIYITVMTLLITSGYNRKTLSAIIGCSSGVIISGLLSALASNAARLTGFTTEETMYITMNFDIDLNALVFGGVILGAVGAVMDVSMSISSSLKELYDQVEKPTFTGLVKSGITIGRDIMGTMANTLVLAYIGCELSATVIAVAYSSSVTTLFAREKIVVEVMQALVGSIGILLTIPLTAVVSAALYMSMRPENDPSGGDKYYVEPSNEPSLFERMEKDENDQQL